MIMELHGMSDSLKSLGIDFTYVGPMWDSSIRGIAEMIKNHLDFDADLPVPASMAVFSVFVEQVTNIIMYSAEKDEEVPVGTMVLGRKNGTHFIQTGNVVRNDRIDLIRERINSLNMMNKQELRKFYRQQLEAGDDNPDSKGAGIGLIEIAKRATVPMEYHFKPMEDGKSYFTLYVEVGREAK